MVPLRSVVLGFGAMVPLATAAAVSAAVPAARATPLPRAGIVWGGTVLAFLGGVRRGLSFRTPAGPTGRQMKGMARLFGLALAALLSPSRPVACGLLATGFLDLAIDDREMAQDAEAPPFFAALRPPQAAIAIASLLVLATACTRSSGEA